MRNHEVDDLVIAQLWIIETKFLVGCPFASEEIARADAHEPDKLGQALS